MLRNSLLLLSIFFVPVYGFATDRLFPTDLTYQGAFRTPTGTRNGASFGNGYLYSAMGWDSANNCLLITARSTSSLSMVECVDPATPVVSATKDLAELNRATTHSGLSMVDITGGTQNGTDLGLLTDVEYLPQQGGQTGGKYYWTRRIEYAVVDNYEDRLGWSDDFSINNANGDWHLNNAATRRWDHYLTKINDTWAQSVLGYNALGVGRGRTNGSFGPSLYAIRPWNDGNPPSDNTALSNKVLIDYPVTNVMESFGYDTLFGDGVWVTSGTKQAFVVVAHSGYREDSNCYACTQDGASKWWHSSGTGRSTAYKNQEAENKYLASSIDTSQTTIPLQSATELTSSGIVKVNGIEYVHYTGISGDSLTGCIRGYHGSIPTAANSGAVIRQVMPDALLYGNGVDGYDSIVRIPMLMFYDVDQIAEIAVGSRQSHDIQPYAYMTLNEFYNAQPSITGGENAKYHSITTDGSSIYIGENFGDIDGYDKYPLIHEFSLGTSGEADTNPPTLPSNVVVDDGIVSWSASEPGAVYVVYKFFNAPHYSLPYGEFRPIRATLATSYTDPHFTSGDQYNIVAYDRSMNKASLINKTLRLSTGQSRFIKSAGTGRFQ